MNAFVRRHFSLRGSLRLHRAALGRDLLAAPLNVALAPVFLLTRLVAMALALIGLRRAGRWLLDRPIFIHSALARRLERHIEAELWVPRATDASGLDGRQRQLLRDYTSVRTAVSEIFTTLVLLALGFALFHDATPGVVSLTPLVSDYVAQSTAIAEFPLGRGIGNLWYSAFPAELPILHVIGLGVALAACASLVTTFAGILADPLQARFGLHRKRLLRLLATMDAAGARGSGLAPEHAIARLADLTDAGVSVARFLRG
ncbi:DUF6635 family protein [Tropicimonas sp. IMCC6043]|uniref:DUF6635 family protein n=1 Tax=Tropicimonas sp. IMCC6043 TaxID=2510645 RepID=UPI001F5C0D2F|nr:DUF6635 family protein [Tropicimonas sp. IMCC6043]